MTTPACPSYAGYRFPADHQATCAWYTQHFGFIPGDVQVLPDGSPMVSCLRLDLGDTPADHHTLALAQGFAPGYSHSAYEVVEADAVGIGQRSRAIKDGNTRGVLDGTNWAAQFSTVGRTPWGDKHEHYCDGGLFTAEWKMFIRVRAGRSQYLKAGNLVEACIASPDGSIDLGVQRNGAVDGAA